jgi:hypothetical protein
MSLAILLLTGSSYAGWEAIVLTPSGDTSACAYAVSGGQQGGYAYSSSYGTGTYGAPLNHAALWMGSSSSFVDLNPARFVTSQVNGIGGGQQVGFAETICGMMSEHAALWNGSSNSFVDLTPSGYTTSCAYGVSNGQQVGVIYGPPTSSTYHAVLWSGTASSFIDLSPNVPNNVGSYAYAINNGQQAGVVIEYNSQNSSNECHAALWSGTSSSFVDLRPAGFAHAAAQGISNGWQTGYGRGTVTGNYEHALLWHGTSNSFVDLNPSGYRDSEANGISNGVEVGFAQGAPTGYFSHAGLWTGSAAGFVDLHALLPAGAYSQSCANGIDVSGSGEIWITGMADNDAVTWHFVPGAVSGKIQLQDYYPSVAGITGAVEIQDSVGNILETHNIVLASDGTYSFSTPRTGAYTAAAKCWHWLAQAQPVIVDSNGNGAVNFSLKNGDVNGDNFVEDQDYALMGAAWYSVVGDANYNPSADLNGDGAVEDADYSIMGMNWYLGGDKF